MRTLLENVDASWLRMDEPANHMVVTGVLVLGDPVPTARVRRLIEERLLRFDRFRQRIVPPVAGIGPPSWEDDPDFSLDHHFVEARLDEPGDEAALQTFVSRLVSRPLPPGRPLWQYHFLPEFQGGSALVTRIHHCVADGLALVRVLLAHADGAPEIPMPSRREDELPLGSVPAVLAREAAAELAVLGRGAREALRLATDPARLGRSGAEAARHLGALLRLLLLPPDPATALKGPLALEKKVAWSRPFRLEDFKSIGRVTGATVNDVLMAALAGSLRRYLLGRGEISRQLVVRGVVPVNLRVPGDVPSLGNRFGLVFLPLPLGIEDPLERLFEIRSTMRAIKRSPEASAIFELLWAVGAAPRRVFDLLLDLFGSKATAVVTNVIGPRETISLAGSRLRHAMFWVPAAGHLGLGVSLLSYAGNVWVGVQCDAGLIPDPGRILASFDDEVSALLALGLEVAA